MWYNLTTQLHDKTERLGKVLVGLGAKLGHNIPWPILKTEKNDPCEDTEDAKEASSENAEDTNKDASNTTADVKKSPVKVEFYSIPEFLRD